MVRSITEAVYVQEKVFVVERGKVTWGLLELNHHVFVGAPRDGEYGACSPLVATVLVFPSIIDPPPQDLPCCLLRVITLVQKCGFVVRDPLLVFLSIKRSETGLVKSLVIWHPFVI